MKQKKQKSPKNPVSISDLSSVHKSANIGKRSGFTPPDATLLLYVIIALKLVKNISNKACNYDDSYRDLY